MDVPLPYQTLPEAVSGVRREALREWLRLLRSCLEHECMSILYAKSVLVVQKDPSMVSSPRSPKGERSGLNASSSIGNVNDSSVDDPGRRRFSRMLPMRERIFSSAFSSSISSPSSLTSSQLPGSKRDRHTLSTSHSIDIVEEAAACAGYGVRRVVSGRAPLVLPSASSSFALRHSIHVNDHEEQANAVNSNDAAASSSVKSADSQSTASVDSGQCSAECGPFLSSQPSLSYSLPDDIIPGEASSSFARQEWRRLPGYARMASTMDHILRTASSIFTLLSRPTTSSSTRSILDKAIIFMQIIETSPCANCMDRVEMQRVKEVLHEMENGHCHTSCSFVAVRSLLLNTLHVCIVMICRYLSECSGQHRLLSVALPHLIHTVLFGDDLCLVAIQSGGIECLLRLARDPLSSQESRCLALRGLALLCALDKGCVHFLALDGLPLALSCLNSPSLACSIESAGVLTQLTSPSHSFIHLSDTKTVIRRLLDVLDECESAESLLLVLAALANVSHNSPTSLYQLNAVKRLVAAYRRNGSSSIFVQEQFVTILSRLAGAHYESALVCQGAVPVLLEMLSLTDSHHSDYSRRIRYRAAVCIGTLASTGIGLKALHDAHAYAIVHNVLESERKPSNPIQMICSNIKSLLERRYHFASEV